MINECENNFIDEMFSFGFSEDQLDNDEITVTSSPQVQDNITELDHNPPQAYDLNQILTSLREVKLSYNESHGIYKRELFDIKHQVMTEDNEALNNILIANESDLNKNSYEGGFKSWECSYDVIDYLTIEPDFFTANQNIIEIGSGTSLPCCHILKHKLLLNDDQPLNLVLSDFNYDVLRLVTVPNLLINWYLLKYDHEEIITITDDIIDAFITDLSRANITLSFISGSWGSSFLSLLHDTQFDLIITSETIYSLDSMPILANMLISLLSSTSLHRTSPKKCIVAAKDYYFGVGGSVIAFIQYLELHSSLTINVHSVSSQLKRSIIELS